MSLDDELRCLAEQQHALVTRRQARELGASTAAIAHRLSGPDWDAPTARILRLVGAPRTTLQQLMTASLDSDGPISVRSAAYLWRLPGFGFGPVIVSRQKDRGRLPSSIASVHRVRYLPATHVTERHAIPVTTLPRTLFDLAASIHPGRLERLIETVIGRSPSLLNALHHTLDELGASGRDGVAAMRAALANRLIGYVPTESGLEARFARILADAGEPPLERQVDLGGHEWIGRVDFLDRLLGIIFEIDSDLHHSTPMDKAQDRRRDEALKVAGFNEVVRIDESVVWRQPDETLFRVQDARRRWRRALGIPLVARTRPRARVSATRTDRRAG